MLDYVRNGLYVGGHGGVITLFAQSLHDIQNALEEVRDYSLDASMLAIFLPVWSCGFKSESNWMKFPSTLYKEIGGYGKIGSLLHA